MRVSPITFVPFHSNHYEAGLVQYYRTNFKKIPSKKVVVIKHSQLFYILSGLYLYLTCQELVKCFELEIQEIDSIEEYKALVQLIDEKYLAKVQKLEKKQDIYNALVEKTLKINDKRVKLSKFIGKRVPLLKKYQLIDEIIKKDDDPKNILRKLSKLNKIYTGKIGEMGIKKRKDGFYLGMFEMFAKDFRKL